MRYSEPTYKVKDGKKFLFFEDYTVIENNENYFGVYDRNNNLITHRETFKAASKVAKLLQKAYIEGYNDGSSW